MEVSDDLTGLVDFKINVQGYKTCPPNNLQRVIKLPSGLQYYKIDFGTSMTAAVDVKLVCSD